MGKQSHVDACVGAALPTLIISLALYLIPSIEYGHAQSQQAPSPPPPPVQPNIAKLQAEGHVFKLGEPCKQLSGKAGIIKRDACERWYCSRLDYQDITERVPNFAARIGCTWQLVGIHCQCKPK